MNSSAMLSSNRKKQQGCLQEVGNYCDPRVVLSPKEIQDYNEKYAKSQESPRRNAIGDKSASSDEENARTATRKKKATSARRPARKSRGNHDYRDYSDLSDADSSRYRVTSPKKPTRNCFAQTAEDAADSQLGDKRCGGQSSAESDSAVHPRPEEEAMEVGLAKTRGRRSAVKQLYGEFSCADDSQVEDEAKRRGRRSSARSAAMAISSADDSQTEEVVKPVDERKRRGRRLLAKPIVSVEISSGDDSQTEYESMKMRSASTSESAKDADSKVSPQKSPKRQKDESDSDHGRRKTRKSLRMGSPIREEPEAASPRNTPRSRSSRGTGTDTPEARTPGVTTLSSRLESGLSLKRLQESLDAMMSTDNPTETSDGEEGSTAVATRTRKPPAAKITSDDEEHGVFKSAQRGGVTRKSRRLSERVPSGAATRKSGRLASAEETSDVSDDFLPKGKLTRMPRTPKTPKSTKRTKTPSAREVDDMDGISAMEDDEATTKQSKTPRKTPSKTPRKTPAKAMRNMTPSMPARSSSISGASSSMEVIRANLHVSAVPNLMPCREREFDNIYTFVGKSINESVGGAMFISGLPGSGKTATVHAVVRRLQQHVDDGELPPFQFVEVNGLRLTEPRQVFVRILQELTGEKYTSQQAESILEKKFMSKTGLKKAIVLLVDEIDMLRSRKQDIVYKLFEWPRYARSALVVLGIANTMDLPERILAGKVNSRFGFTRLSFKAYEYKQLQEIVTARLQGSDCFNPDAVQLVARKVAAVSGDARRALDICRRATELVSGEKECVTLAVVDRSLKQMMNSVGVKALKACSHMEKLFLQAVVAEIKRTGIEETNFSSVYRQLKAICNFDRLPVPDVTEALAIVSRLGSSRIIRNEHGKAGIMQTITLDVSSDDIHYAITSVAA